MKSLYMSLNCYLNSYIKFLMTFLINIQPNGTIFAMFSLVKPQHGLPTGLVYDNICHQYNLLKMFGYEWAYLTSPVCFPSSGHRTQSRAWGRRSRGTVSWTESSARSWGQRSLQHQKQMYLWITQTMSTAPMGIQGYWCYATWVHLLV